MSRRTWAGALAVAMFALLLAACSGGQQQAAAPTNKNWPTDVAGIVNYQGADREEMLLAGAKNEKGKVVYYTSTSLDAVEKYKERFQKKYPGFEVEIFRQDCGVLLEKVSQEARANKIGFSILSTCAPHFHNITKLGVIQPHWSPGFKELPEWAIDKSKNWVAEFQLIFTAVYNTKLIPPAQAPKSYDDLVKKWGKPVGVVSTSADVFQAQMRMWDKDRAVKFYKDLAQNNEVVFSKEISGLVSRVVAGEVALGMFVHNHDIERLKGEGAPIDWVHFNPSITYLVVRGLAKDLPNPHATMLFMDWLNSKEGYQVIQEVKRIPPHPQVKPEPPALTDVPGFFALLPEWADAQKEDTQLYHSALGL